jgi:hypothetical protein
MSKTSEKYLYKVSEENIRHLEEGDVILLRPYKNKFKYLAAFILMNIGRLKWSHVVIYHKDGYIYESDINGVVYHDMTKLSYYINDYEMMILRFKDSKHIKPFLKKVKEKIGAKYDFLQLFSIGFLKLISMVITLRSRKNLIDFSNKYVCSELVGQSLKDINLDPKKLIRVSESQITPDDLLKLKIFKVVIIDIDKDA